MTTPQYIDDRQRAHRTAGTGLAIGAAILIIVTWLELYLGPQVGDDPETALVTTGGTPIHILSFVAFILVLYGIYAIAAVQPQGGRRIRISALAVGFGFYLGVVPHTVLDFTAIPIIFDTLPAAEAVEFANRMYMIIGPLALVGMLTLVVSMIVLSLATRRVGVMPRWVWMTGLLFLPAAVVLLVLEAVFPGVRIPHMPIAFDAALLAYGLGVRKVATASEPVPAPVAAQTAPA